MTGYDHAAAKIRAALKMTRGARLCGVGGCQVITQGGADGLRQHRQVIHPGDTWFISDSEEEEDR